MRYNHSIPPGDTAMSKPLPFGIDPFVLEHCFHKLERNGETYYWRECVQRDGMRPDEVGYMIIYSDGEHLHTYNHPEGWL